MCQGLLPSRRHFEKREDPGDEVGLAPCELDFSVDFGVVSLEKMELGMRFKGTSVVEIFSDKLGTCLSIVWLF